MGDVAHLSPETIAAYRDGGLTPEERDRADDHLAGCPECIGWLSRTARTADAVERATIKATRPPSTASSSTASSLADSERQTVSIMGACAMVGVSRRTIYNWIEAGKVEYRRTAGGSIRIFVDTLWREPDGSTLNERDAT